jgi:LmeA-like phospholipid-binding
LIRRLLLVLLILAFGVGADFAAARVFESKVTAALERKYQLGNRPIVQVRDFPFLPHLLTGRFSTVDLAADEARAEGVTLDSVEVHLRGVRVPWAVLLGRHGEVRVDRADGQVELSQEQVNQLLGDRLQGGTVVIDTRGVRIKVEREVLGRRVDAVVAGRLVARGGRLAFQPQSIEVGGVRDQALETSLLPSFSFDVPLPPLPADIEVERVDTGPGQIVLAGRAGGIAIPA